MAMVIAQVQSTEMVGSTPQGNPLLVAGQDGTNVRTVKTDASGHPEVVGAGSPGSPLGGVMSVQGTVGGQALPVSVAALPLPAGAATEASLAAVAASTASIAAVAGDGLTDAELRAAPVPVSGTFWQATQPVSAASLPLPAGAATEATLAAIKAKTDNLDVALSTRAVTGLTDAQLRASAVPVTAASLPLPSGAATSALQTAGNASLTSLDGKTPALGQAAMAASVPVVLASDQSALPVSIGSIALPTGAATEVTLAALNTKVPVQGQAVKAASVPVTLASDQGALAISASSLPLPAGAATEATVAGLLTNTQLRAAAVPVSMATAPLPTGAATEATLSALNAKVPAQGQAAMAASVPVVLASNQSAVPVSGTFWQATQPVSAASLPLPAGAATEASLAAQSVVDNAGFTDGTTRVQPAGFILDETAGTALTENDAGAARMDSKRAQVITVEDTTTRGRRMTVTAANAAKVDGSAVTQPISAASLPLPAGAATEATLTSVDGKVTNISNLAFEGTDHSSVYVRQQQLPTFTVRILGASLVSGRYLIGVQVLSSDFILRIHGISLRNVGTGTGAVCDFSVFRGRGLSDGTALTIHYHDPADADLGISNSSAAGVDASMSGEFSEPITRRVLSTDGWDLTTTEQEVGDNQHARHQPWFIPLPNGKPITLRKDDIHDAIGVKVVTGSVEGKFDAEIVYTLEKKP